MLRSLIATLVLTSAALVAPAAASAAPAADDYPRGRTLYPGLIEPGGETPLLHMQEGVIVDRAIRVPVRGFADIWILGRVGTDYLVETASADFEHYAVRLVHPDGSRRVLQRFTDRTTATVSADGSRLALVTLTDPGTRIRVVRTRSGELVRQRTFATYGVTVTDYGRRRMVLTGLRDRTYWWNPETGRLTLLVPHFAAADIAANRLVVTLPSTAAPSGECQRTVRLDRPSVVLWRSCHDRPLVFSPDGTRMLTSYILSDGIGPAVIQVRRTHGAVLRTYRAPLYFGFLEWETNGRVLVQPVGKTYVAAVRCDVLRGWCHRASRLYESPGTYDPPVTMRWSFPR